MRPIKYSVDSAVNPVGNAIPLDIYANSTMSIQVYNPSGVTHTLEVTNDNIFDSTITPNWFDHTEAATVGTTGNYQATLLSIPRAVRHVINAGAGKIDVVIIQNGR